MLLLDCAGEVGRVGRDTHGCAVLLRSSVGDWTHVHATTEPHRLAGCQADAGRVSPFGDLRPARCGGMVLPWDGPAPALTRGASTRRSEDRFYALWWELCGVKLSIHEPSGGRGATRGRSVCPTCAGRAPDPDSGTGHRCRRAWAARRCHARLASLLWSGDRTWQRSRRSGGCGE